MSSQIILDGLITSSNGNTFYYDERTCSKELIKEVILRGLQVYNLYPFLDFNGGKGEGCGEGGGKRRFQPSYGFGEVYGSGSGSGRSFGIGSGQEYSGLFGSGQGEGEGTGDFPWKEDDGYFYAEEFIDDYEFSLPSILNNSYGII